MLADRQTLPARWPRVENRGTRMRPPGGVVCVSCPSGNHAKFLGLRMPTKRYENRHSLIHLSVFHPHKSTKSHNPYPGAQGVMSLEGSSAVRIRAVEWAVQPAGCSTTARAQEGEPDIWEALTVLHHRVGGRDKRGEPELIGDAVQGVGGPNRSVDLGERMARGPRRAKAARAGVSLRRAT